MNFITRVTDSNDARKIGNVGPPGRRPFLLNDRVLHYPHDTGGRVTTRQPTTHYPPPTTHSPSPRWSLRDAMVSSTKKTDSVGRRGFLRGAAAGAAALVAKPPDGASAQPPQQSA